MIQSGLLLFFLVPGLLGYCALYGIFHSGRSVAPEPPPASSIEALTLILLGSAFVHVVVAGIVHINRVIAANVVLLRIPAGLVDPYRTAFSVMGNANVSADALGGLIGIALLQGLAFYWLIRQLLRYLVARDRLPHSIYGWATEFANAADDDDRLIVAYAVTNHDYEGKPVVYVGLLYEMGLKPDRSISRLSLYDCERYLGELGTPVAEKTLAQPLSRFPFLLIEGTQIRNVAFEVIDLADTGLDTSAPPD